jgi:acyl-CoA synthetase (AMP-forming)/AMP-acid ligase II
VDHLAHKRLRLWPKREIDPSLSPKQVRNDRITTTLHALEQQRRTTFGNYTAMDLGDPVRTAETFVEHAGSRWVLTGDFATVEADGTINLLGRGSQCINTGGEKVFSEEVEMALQGHPDVADVVVVGVDDERWGQAVCAVVQAHPGASPDLDDLRERTRAVLAGYKLPKRLVLVDEIVRSPAGKADYRWAHEVANLP